MSSAASKRSRAAPARRAEVSAAPEKQRIPYSHGPWTAIIPEVVTREDAATPATNPYISSAARLFSAGRRLFRDSDD